MTAREQIDRLWKPRWTLTCPRGRRASLLSIADHRSEGFAHTAPGGNGAPNDQQFAFLLEHLNSEAFEAQLREESSKWNRIAFWAVDNAAIQDGVTLVAQGDLTFWEDHLDDHAAVNADGIQILALPFLLERKRVRLGVHFAMADWSTHATVTAQDQSGFVIPAADSQVRVQLEEEGEGGRPVGFRCEHQGDQEYVIEVKDQLNPHQMLRVSSVILRIFWKAYSGILMESFGDKVFVRSQSMATQWIPGEIGPPRKPLLDIFRRKQHVSRPYPFDDPPG